MKKYFVEFTKGEYCSEVVGHGYMASVRHPQILTPSGDIIYVNINREFEESNMKKYSMTEEQINAIDSRFMQFASEVIE